MRDSPKPDETAKAKLRAQALGWLSSELTAWRNMAMTDTQGTRELVAKSLDHWKQDSDLAGIRDTAALAKLPEPERKAWQDFWTEVGTLRAHVAGGSH